MTKNIKEIGKELMGKSLNSYHRKTGLPQLEKNNEMQDGILNGILSQVDNAYIKKTEQSNVIHLDGSGDGVVIVDNIEGNTLVNCIRFNKTTSTATTVDNNIYTFTRRSLTENNTSAIFDAILKDNTTYTIAFDILKNDYSSSDYSEHRIEIVRSANIGSTILLPANSSKGCYKRTFTTNFSSNDVIDSTSQFWVGVQYLDFKNKTDILGDIIIGNIVVLEGDWTNKEIPPYFEGLQSSFEEQVEEDKYKIEILMNNANLWDGSYTIGSISTIDGTDITNGTNRKRSGYIKVKPNTTYMVKQSNYINDTDTIFLHQYNDNTNTPSLITWSSGGIYQSVTNMLKFTTSPNTNYIRFRTQDNRELNGSTVTISPINVTNNIPNKQNKIKLLINEPLRAFGDVKDKLYIKDKKLVVKRELSQILINGSEDTKGTSCTVYGETLRYGFKLPDVKIMSSREEVHCISDGIPSNYWNCEMLNVEWVGTHPMYKEGRVTLFKTKADTLERVKTYLSNNPIKLVYQLEEPYYEEVLNEYGEPIILEGYENGTIYIDSTIVPTTTVRYTPKIESFKTLKEVSNNNIMLTNDISDTIIPYMMEVDLMIMEKEMSLFNSLNKNIRKMEVLDMTSMQKRTGEMLERLIKGKSLNEQECKTRVTVYLNAGKITDEQAEELMLLISEIYA